MCQESIRMLENIVVTNILDAIINFIKTMNVCLFFFSETDGPFKVGSDECKHGKLPT